MQKITRFLSRYLKPSQITMVYTALCFVLIVLFVMTVSDGRKSEPKSKNKEADITNIITSKSTRDFGLDAVNDKTTSIGKTVNTLEKQVDSLTGKVNETASTQKSSKELARELKETKEKLAKLQRVQSEQANDIDARVKKALAYHMDELGVKGILKDESFEIKSPTTNVESQPKIGTVDPKRRPTRNSNFSYGNDDRDSTTKIAPQSESTGNKSKDDEASSSYVPNAIEQRTEQLFTIVEQEHEVIEESDEIYLPKGAILSGVLLTGFDAPTQASASENPMPVLVRIKKEAILPNYKTMKEVRECFALLAGYGDLSSERAHLRGEVITCVKESGEVIEKDFGSYAVGEDGKAGLKGTLVTRNSAILVRTMMAGFMSGMASAFDVTPVPVIATESNGTQQYQDVWSASAVQGGVAKGASAGLERLADYYMDLADQMHPIIEIGGGRAIDMIITEGTTL